MLSGDDFRLFLAIAREGSLSAAARRLGVDQSTVSRRLVGLEASARTRLFERTPDGYVLSPAGAAVRADIEALEDRALAVERKLESHDGRVEGRVRLATSDSFATWFLVRHLGPLRERHPNLALELVTGNQTASLARREADLSLRLVKPTEPSLVTSRLGSAAWAAYASEAYVARRGRPSVRSAFAGHDLVGYEGELRSTAGARWLGRKASRGRVVLASNSLLPIAAAVVAGVGVSALPCVMGDLEPSLLRLPSGVIGEHDVWLVVHPDVKASARVRAVMNYLKELISREAPLLSGLAPHPRRYERARAPR